MGQKDSHCSFCGAAFGRRHDWPRQCDRCRMTTYRNPLPVAVVLVPIDGGLLAVRRDIPPHRGRLVLPGGFINYGETWQEGAARELFEESSVRIDPASVRPFAVHSSPPGLVIIFGLADPISTADLPPFVANEEATERAVVRTAGELAFDQHHRVADDYFNGRSPTAAPRS